jgi:hypothetical protein
MYRQSDKVNLPARLTASSDLMSDQPDSISPLSEPNDRNAEDWRMEQIDTENMTIDIGGQIHSGLFTAWLADSKVLGNQEFYFRVPSAPALFLDLSYRLHIEAENILVECMQAATPLVEGGVAGLGERKLYTFFERYMGSVVFAHTALEAFVNDELPKEYVHEVPNKAYTRRYSKSQIERHLSLREKLECVLPAAWQIESPQTQEPVWIEFLKLEKLRHDIIHLKSADRRYSEDSPLTIWSRTLERPLSKAFENAKALMGHFYTRLDCPPDWFRNCPF